MFCRFCGKQIPSDSRFCPACGQAVAEQETPAPAPAPEPQDDGVRTQVFTFPKDTAYDQASVPVNQWLSERGLSIVDARFEVEATLLAGTLVPTISRLELDWTPEETDRRYQFAVMLDSRTGLGSGKKSGVCSKSLQRQFDRWRGEHPALEVAGRQDVPLSLGWLGTWVALFFYR